MSRRVSIPAWCGAVALAWFGVLWWLSSQKGHGGPDLFANFDKVEHFGYFFGGGGLMVGALAKLHRRFLIAWLILVAVGVIDEWHQLYTPGRSGGDPWDLLADACGAAAGIWVWETFVRKRLRGCTNRSGACCAHEK